MNKKKGNKYKIEGDIVKVELHRRNEDNLYTYIDTDDLQRIIIDFPYTWFAGWNEPTKSFYARCTIHNTKLFNGIHHLNMNNIIMNPYLDKKFQVDHINHDTLDNRKANLRCTDFINNATNRHGANSNNKTGFRNISLINGFYIVQLQIGGKNKCLGKFKKLEDAVPFAEEMRQKYYGEFAGKG